MVLCPPHGQGSVLEKIDPCLVPFPSPLSRGPQSTLSGPSSNIQSSFAFLPPRECNWIESSRQPINIFLIYFFNEMGNPLATWLSKQHYPKYRLFFFFFLTSRQNHHQFRKRIGFSVSLTTTAGWPMRNTKKEKTNSHDYKARPIIIITYTTHCTKSIVV